jgi:hypothetical protein
MHSSLSVVPSPNWVRQSALAVARVALQSPLQLDRVAVEFQYIVQQVFHSLSTIVLTRLRRIELT